MRKTRIDINDAPSHATTQNAARLAEVVSGDAVSRRAFDDFFIFDRMGILYAHWLRAFG